MELTMCGYRCDLCKAYAPNIAQRDERVAQSEMWKKYYDLDIPPEDCTCDGCRSCAPDARRVDMGCPVRTCVMERSLAHCGQCAQYPCDMFKSRTGLTREEAATMLEGAFDPGEYDQYLLAFDNKTRLDALR